MNNDLISRSYLKQMIPAPIEDEYKYVHQIIDNAPTVEPLYTITSNTFVEGASMRPQGEWITKGYEPYGRCNICNEVCEINNFCGHCGAEMKGGAE